MNRPTTAPSVGQRIRDIRTWRKQSLRATAELAGITAGYLSQLERDLKPLEKRATLEGIARALRVAPSDLGAAPGEGRLDPELAKAHDAVPDIEAALIETSFGEAIGNPRPWEAVQADADHLHSVLRVRSDRAAVLQMLPRHLRELNALLASNPWNRREVLEALALTLRTAAGSTKILSAPGLPALAALQMHTVARELDEPAWLGLAAFVRAQVMSQGVRERTRELSRGAADELQPHVGSDDRARQVYGMLHLNAALGSAVLGDADSMNSHLREAREAAERAPEPRDVGFANLGFGRTNVQIWEIGLTLEIGDPGQVPELSRSIVPELAASRSRQGAYWVDMGRSHAMSKRYDDAVVSLARGEALAPVQTRSNTWAKETVRQVMRRRGRRDDAIARELRGLAHRMGLAA